MSDPYCGVGFFSFFFIFFQRIIRLFPGGLCPDELQILLLLMITGIGVLLGPFLIYRTMAMMANALSHTLLLGLALAYMIFLWCGYHNIHSLMDTKVLMSAALFSALLTLGLHHLIIRLFVVQHEAAVGFVFTSLFALGLLVVSLISKNVHIGTELIMGNIDTVVLPDLYLMLEVMGGIAMILGIYRRGMLLSTCDRHGALLSGFSPLRYDMLMLLMTAVATTVSFKSVGVFMTLAFFLIPTLIAVRIVHTYWLVFIYSFVIGSFFSLCGVALSRGIYSSWGIGLSTGGIVVFLLAIGYATILLFYQKRV